MRSGLSVPARRLATRKNGTRPVEVRQAPRGCSFNALGRTEPEGTAARQPHYHPTLGQRRRLGDNPGLNAEATWGGIEMYFKVHKSGFRVEAYRRGTADRLTRYQPP